MLCVGVWGVESFGDGFACCGTCCLGEGILFGLGI